MNYKNFQEIMSVLMISATNFYQSNESNYVELIIDDANQLNIAFTNGLLDDVPYNLYVSIDHICHIARIRNNENI